MVHARLLVLLLGVTACDRSGAPDDDGRTHAGEPFVHLRGTPRDTSTPEHRFLSHLMAHETTLARMLRQAAGSAGSPAWRAELERMRDLQEADLASLRGALRAYPDRQHPVGETSRPEVADSLGERLESSEERLLARIITAYREEVADIDVFLPRLTSSDVGTLARRVRSQRIADIQRLLQGERLGRGRQPDLR